MLVPMRTIALSLLMVIACTACRLKAENRSSSEAKVEVTPITLFTGSEFKYQPFFSTPVGAVKLHYKGKQRNMKISIDIWEEGKKTRTEEEMTKGLMGGTDGSTFSFDGEILITVKNNAALDKPSLYELAMSDPIISPFDFPLT